MTTKNCHVRKGSIRKGSVSRAIRKSCLVLMAWGWAVGAHAGQQEALIERLTATSADREQYTEAVYRTLQNLGSEGVESAFDLLAGSKFQPDEESAARILSGGERLALLTSFARLDSSQVQGLLKQRLDAKPTVEDRLAAIQVLRFVEQRGDLSSLIAIMDVEVDFASYLALLRQFEAASRVILSRSTAAQVGSLVSQTLGAPRVIQERIIHASDGFPLAQRVEFLTQLLGNRSYLDVALLGELQLSSQAFRMPVAPSSLSKVHPFIAKTDPHLAAIAIQICGNFHDYSASDRLLDALESGSPSVRSAAEKAFQKLSGLALPGNTSRWRSWVQEERQWFESVQNSAGWLPTANAVERTRLVNDLAIHRWKRDEMAARLGALLPTSQPSTARLICAVLAQIDSLAALPGLVAALHQSEPSVRRAAITALHALTGKSLDDRPQSWERELASELSYLRAFSAW